MDIHDLQMPSNHLAVIDRFVAACQTDSRIVAAFLGGSYAKGAADAFSDLDLYLVTTEDDYDAFLAQRDTFVEKLGEPLFLDDFGKPHAAFFIFSDETEGELWIGHERAYQQIHAGMYITLLDKKSVLTGAVFPGQAADVDGQIAFLRKQVSGFWHELAHFNKAMGRAQLWFAYGQLEVMRRICVNLARLQFNFVDASVGDEPYFKVEQSLPEEYLQALRSTVCPMSHAPMLQAAKVITRFYADLAHDLTMAHHIAYQPALERMLFAQLEKLAVENQR